MTVAISQYPRGSIEAGAAIGQAYVDFARRGPWCSGGSLARPKGCDKDAELQGGKGVGCFAVVLQAVAHVLGSYPGDPEVQARAYMMWSTVRYPTKFGSDGS